MGRISNETKALRDLYFFSKEICGFRDLSPKLHGDICQILSDAFIGEKPHHQAIVIPRDMFKSSLGVATVLWLFTREAVMKGNYEWRTLIDTATLTLGTKHLNWIGRTMSSKRGVYKKTFGDFYEAGRGFGTREIYVARRSQGGVHREPNFMATAVRAEVTGLHFDFHWYDDIVSERNWHTKNLRQKSIEHFYASLNLLEPHGRILYTATAWHDGDCLGVLRKSEAERKRKGEAPFISLYVRAAMEDSFGIPDDVKGESIFPERWPTEKLKAKKLDMERGGQKFMWRAQHMNDPTLPEYAIPFDRNTLYVSRQKFPDRMRLKVVTVDPNFRSEDQVSGDNAAIIVGGFDQKANWWGLDVRLGQWRPDAFIEQLFDVYLTWRPHIFRIEKKFTAHLISAIRHQESIRGVILPMTLIERDWRSKEMRYAGMATIFSSGRIRFADEIGADVKAEMEEELERVGASAKDDFLDALMDQFTTMYPVMSKESDQTIPTFPTIEMPGVKSMFSDGFQPEVFGFQQMTDEETPWQEN